MTLAPGKGFPACSSCINRELDPFQCEGCNKGSNWEGHTVDDPEEGWDEISLDDLRGLIRGGRPRSD